MQERTTTTTTRSFLQENLGWMLASLLLATLVWYIASSAQNPIEQRRFPSRLPIQLLTDDGMVIINDDVTTAQVTIRAPQSVWNVLEANDISVVADLSKKPSGKYIIPLSAALSAARRGTVTDIQPSQITVELARRSEQLVSVNVLRTGDPPPGFIATSTTSEQTVRITGAEDNVERVVAAQARINMQDERAGFTRNVPLIAVDAQGNEVDNVTIAPAEVTVTVDIRTRPDVYELAVIPQLSGEPPLGYFRSSYEWEPKTVIVRGDAGIIQTMNGFIATEAIDLTGKTETFTQHIKLVLPEGVTMPEQVDVNVTVEIKPIEVRREFNNIPVLTQGLDTDDYAITIQPDRISVIVTGPQLVLDALTANDLSVIAPLTGLGVGKHQVTLRASVTKPGIKAENISLPADTVDVTIVSLHPTPTPTPDTTPELQATP